MCVTDDPLQYCNININIKYMYLKAYCVTQFLAKAALQ